VARGLGRLESESTSSALDGAVDDDDGGAMQQEVKDDACDVIRWGIEATLWALGFTLFTPHLQSPSFPVPFPSPPRLFVACLPVRVFPFRRFPLPRGRVRVRG